MSDVPAAVHEPAFEPTEVLAADRPDAATVLDLDAVERDLADVELALARLDTGAYWTDEVTGAPIPDDELAAHPTTRRAGGR